jgi:hypothetical protein
MRPMRKSHVEIRVADRRIAARIAIAAALAVIAAPMNACAVAAEGGFSVSKLTLRAFVNADASVGLVCDATIHNRRGAPALTVVRVPTPSQEFRLGEIRAALDGAAITDIRLPLDSDTGFEVWLGRQAISAGARGRLHVEYTLANEVRAAGDAAARLHVVPPRFAGQADGATNVTVTAVLPPDTPVSQVRPNFEHESQAVVFMGRPAITWRRPEDRGRDDPFEVEFPRRGMTRVATRSMLGAATVALAATPWLRALLAATTVAIFGLVFFRTTKGKHVIVFLVMGGTLGALSLRSPAAQLLLLPALLCLAAGIEWRLRRRLAIPAKTQPDAEVADQVEYVVEPVDASPSPSALVFRQDVLDKDEDADVEVEIDDGPEDSPVPPSHDAPAPGANQQE